MRASRIVFITPRIPALSLYALSLGLFVAGLAQVVAATDAYYGYRIELGLALLSLMLVNVVLAVAISTNALRRSSALATLLRSDAPPSFAFRLTHLAVSAYAALVLPSILPLLQTLLDAYVLPFMIWTSLAGASTVIALLNRLLWDARFATLGAVASLAVFGCAVGFAPTIYGWDLRPLGWYAILASSVPGLAFLALFLRRYSRVFSQSRWRRRGLVAALFAALACALALYMAANPANKFSENLRAAVDGGASEIRFVDLTDFKWDAVEIYTPYTFVDSLSINAREKADIVSLSYLGFNQRMDFIAFLRDEEIVHYEVVWHDSHKIRELYP